MALLIGAVGMVLYVAAAVALADHVVALHWSVALLYFLVAGLAWILPAQRLVRWGLGPEGSR
jgi:ABC-type siderophore export system fused ATPase/permease subunit